MALSPQFSLIHSEFNEFLFAAVGDEEDGRPLTVLSALTRLGLDPWEEAARWSVLPKEAAARALAAAIAMLPEGDWKVSDLAAIAAALVNRLPTRGGPAIPSRQRDAAMSQKAKPRLSIWLIGVLFAAAMLFAIWQQYADHASAPPPPSAASATQR